MDWLSILLLALVALWIIAALVYLRRHGACGCGTVGKHCGCCNHCERCRSSENCHR